MQPTWEEQEEYLIEQKLGKPVITAVQAMFWQSLRLAGFKEKISGYGQLMCL